MPLTITQSNKKDYISRDFIFNTRKDKIVIGWKVFGIGRQFEIPCEDVKEFKVLDEKSKPIKTTSAMKKTGGAVVGGLINRRSRSYNRCNDNREQNQKRS